MSRSITTLSLLAGSSLAVLLASGCSSSSTDASGSGGSGGSAGNTGSGGSASGATGGTPGTGGTAGAHATASGGAIGQGGTTAGGGGAGGRYAIATGGTAGSGQGYGGGAGGIGAAGAAGYPGAAGGSSGAYGGGLGGAGPVPGTTSIFDGKTLNGWVQGSPMLWSVVNGVIDGKGTTGGQLLMTQADYGDFRVIVSSNMVAVGGSGHLGICFWGSRKQVGGYNNCKLIIPPQGYTWDYKLGGALKGVTNIGKPTTNPTWNTTEILCFLARGFCRVAINGTAVLTYQEPTLTSIMAGPIGLQIHNGTNEEVQYKDVFVDPAPTVDKLLTVK